MSGAGLAAQLKGGDGDGGEGGEMAPLCRFGAVAVTSRALTTRGEQMTDGDDVLLCVSPAALRGAPGAVTLQVALNGVQFAAGAVFMYTEACSGAPTCAATIAT